MRGLQRERAISAGPPGSPEQQQYEQQQQQQQYQYYQEQPAPKGERKYNVVGSFGQVHSVNPRIAPRGPNSDILLRIHDISLCIRAYSGQVYRHSILDAYSTVHVHLLA